MLFEDGKGQEMSDGRGHKTRLEREAAGPREGRNIAMSTTTTLTARKGNRVNCDHRKKVQTMCVCV